MTMREALYGKTLAHQLACELENDGYEKPHEEFYLEMPTCLSGGTIDYLNSLPLDYLCDHTKDVLINDGYVVGLRYAMG